ncbi:MAG: hypothetical protein SPJ16_00340 [Helicobacter sp.]|uniref:hypothetical protein n=1 Tax=Helicobacter sp. TaxID=218 RepID=UPI002A919AAB|nr:hypothetical protein [Helicobacter sp.]MDY5949637.1 hypothetical protein [Helicobacter sp.]
MQTIQLQQTNIMTKKLLQKKGAKALFNGNFQGAFYLFESAFWLDTHDLDSKIGLYLADMGMDFGQEAIGIYDFYQSILSAEKRSNKHRVQRMILSLIEAFDNKTHKLSKAMQRSKNEAMDSYDAISYADIKALLKTKDFKEIYSGLPINTKLVFGEKGDFYEFLSLLVQNDYIEALLHYIDSLPRYDMELIPLIEAANNKLKKNKAKKQQKVSK